MTVLERGHRRRKGTQRTSSNFRRERSEDHRDGAEDRINPDRAPIRPGVGLSGCRNWDLASSGKVHHVDYMLWKGVIILPAFVLISPDGIQKADNQTVYGPVS